MEDALLATSKKLSTAKTFMLELNLITDIMS